MTVNVKKCAIPGLLVLTPERRSDYRGFLSETYNAKAFAEIGITILFVQENQSYSAQPGTVRGLHFQRPPHGQCKLIRVARGRIFDVAVDIRKNSPSFGRHFAAELSAANGKQLFVPEGFAHGFCTLEPDTEVIYKISTFYNAPSESGIRWDDAALGIAWPPCAGAALSSKDQTLPLLGNVSTPFEYRAA